MTHQGEVTALCEERDALLTKLYRIAEKPLYENPEWRGMSDNDRQAYERIERKMLALDMQIRARDPLARSLEHMTSLDRDREVLQQATRREAGG